MYCSKYRPFQAMEYKPADRIFRITTVYFPNTYHACLTCKLIICRKKVELLLYKGIQTRRYFELKQTRLSPFWYVYSFLHVYAFNLLKNNAKQHVFHVSLINVKLSYLLICLWTFVLFIHVNTLNVKNAKTLNAFKKTHTHLCS